MVIHSSANHVTTGSSGAADCEAPCPQIVVSCTKGISVDSLETVNQILTRVLPEPLHSRLAYLSGPSFAAEVSASLCDSQTRLGSPTCEHIILGAKCLSHSAARSCEGIRHNFCCCC